MNYKIIRYADPNMQPSLKALLVEFTNLMNARQVGAPMAIATMMGSAPKLSSQKPVTMLLGDVHRVVRLKLRHGTDVLDAQYT